VGTSVGRVWEAGGRSLPLLSKSPELLSRKNPRPSIKGSLLSLAGSQCCLSNEPDQFLAHLLLGSFAKEAPGVGTGGCDCKLCLKDLQTTPCMGGGRAKCLG
jgi:hypothetical protein